VFWIAGQWRLNTQRRKEFNGNDFTISIMGGKS